MGRLGSATCRLGHGLTRGRTCEQWTVATIGARERIQRFVTVDDRTTVLTQLVRPELAASSLDTPGLGGRPAGRTTLLELLPPKSSGTWYCAAERATGFGARLSPSRATAEARKKT